MVKLLTLTKSKYFSKRELFLAITMFVIVFSFLANFVSAAEMKISDEEVERVKTALNIVNTASSFGSVLIDGGNLMTVLKTAIKGGGVVTDVTYGLLVLSAINEMEFMDMVLSQSYKDEARAYFNKILDERTNLTSYWKGVGFDIPKVVSGQITGPMGALTLNTFEMTDKVILILSAINNLKTELRYDGLWYYFDFRRGGDSHQEAWELVEEQMGWAAKSSFIFRGVMNVKSNDSLELEQQFAALYEKWSPYVTPGGISEEYKKQVKDELRNTLAAAIEENTRVKPVYVKEPSFWEKLAVQLANISNAVAKLVSRANPFKAGPPAELSAEFPAEARPPQAEEAADAGSPPVSESVKPGLTDEDEGQEDLDDLLEEADILNQESAEDGPPQAATEITVEEPEPEPELEPEPAEPSEESYEVEPRKIELCQKGTAGAARQYRVLINEIAWMGSQNSPNDEWIELKNIWGIPVSLNGWQVQDKDQQIKLVFEENDVILSGGYLLLERGKDYAGALNNNNEALYLFDNNCQLEDEIIANPDWPGGDNAGKRPMQRFDVLYWYTGSATAGSENISPPAILAHPSASASAPAKKSYPKVLIIEIQIEHISSADYDFVRFYNPNDEVADVSNYQLKKKTSTGSEYSVRVFPDGSTIPAKGYFLWANYGQADVISTQTLAKNNSIALLDPEKNILDQVAWGSSINPFVEGQPYSRNPDETETLLRKWSSTTQGYIDTDDNSEDFQIQSREQGGGGGDQGGETPSLTVVVNEIAWMGTKASDWDEWIELYNNTEEDIDFEGWKLIVGEREISLTGTILADSFYLLERDEKATDIFADLVYGGQRLNNGGEGLELVDAFGTPIDLVDFSSGWPAGQDSPNYISMERVDPLVESDSDNWASNNRITRNGLDADNNPINGTPKAQNSASKSSTQIANGFTITEDATMTYFGSPYLVEGSMIVSGAKLTLEPGVTVKFKHVGGQNQDALLKVENGILEALGTPDQKITFTSSSTQPQAGNWDGLYLKNSISALNNTVVQYGGMLHQPSSYEFPTYTYGAVYIDGGNAQITDSLIEKSKTLGVWLKNSTSTLINGVEFSYIEGDWKKPAAVYIENSSPTIQNSFFRNNNIGILAENSAPTIKDDTFEENQIPIKSTLLPVISGNTVQNNNLNGILLTNFGFSDDISQINWQNAGLPYILESSVTLSAGKTLNIQAGVVVKLKGGGRIYVDGNLQASGQQDGKIMFTALADDEYGGDANNDGIGSSPAAGQWDYIKFSASAASSVLDNVLVRYGGFIGQRGGVNVWDGAIKIDNSAIAIKNSTVENNKIGIGFISGNLAVSSQQIIVQGNEIGIHVAGSCPNLSAVIFGTGDNANTTKVDPDSCGP